MSSETSTDVQSLESQRKGSKAKSSDAGFQPWQLFVLFGLLSAAIVAFVANRQPPSVRVALILTVFAAAGIGVAALRTLAPLTGAVAPDGAQVIGGRTRAALEREKTLALRSIKELEFDHAMGKVSEKDFTEMSGRLRARAARILRQLDAGSGYREEIEREISRRVGGSAASPESGPTIVSSAVASVATESSVSVETGSVEISTHACTSCGTHNDADARFCKGCGSRLEAA